MGKPVFQYLEGDNIYACKTCGIHLAAYNELISKEHAHEESQKYKEGKFILEKEQIKKQYWTF